MKPLRRSKTEHRIHFRTSLTVYFSLLVAGAILLMPSNTVGWPFVVMEVVHAISLYGGEQKLNGEFANVVVRKMEG